MNVHVAETGTLCCHIRGQSKGWAPMCAREINPQLTICSMTGIKLSPSEVKLYSTIPVDPVR
jgi:hypothetical protein